MSFKNFTAHPLRKGDIVTGTIDDKKFKGKVISDNNNESITVVIEVNSTESEIVIHTVNN
ncbi:hypothetical protein [Enterobacter roggenkampii]|uniref:hypothetical protein n=1 Tax=Enterobacter roggenkampii TaxID=1812935 RepID=UPI0020043B74|nr:hypothetical protein [Enterobacter roggenkampii]MCK6840211.1 hypothetical protein [Enterobacter roggenkampii]